MKKGIEIIFDMWRMGIIVIIGILPFVALAFILDRWLK